MNDILVILILLALGSVALYSCLRRKNRGCGGNCGACHGCGGCSSTGNTCGHCHHGDEPEGGSHPDRKG